jgi:hypothetical protein
MDHQVRSSKDIHTNKMNKKAKNQASSHQQGSFNYTQYNQNKKRGPALREVYSHSPQGQSPVHYHQPKGQSYPSWSVFSGNRSNQKVHGGNQGYGNYDGYQSQGNYAKGMKNGYVRGTQSDNYSRSTNPSSNSDGEGNDVFSELSGFTIVQNGMTIYHEEDNTTANLIDGGYSFVAEDHQMTKVKYASSVMTIGPNAHEISLPSFADIESMF